MSENKDGAKLVQVSNTQEATAPLAMMTAASTVGLETFATNTAKNSHGVSSKYERTGADKAKITLWSKATHTAWEMTNVSMFTQNKRECKLLWLFCSEKVLKIYRYLEEPWVDEKTGYCYIEIDPAELVERGIYSSVDSVIKAFNPRNVKGSKGEITKRPASASKICAFSVEAHGIGAARGDSATRTVFRSVMYSAKAKICLVEYDKMLGEEFFTDYTAGIPMFYTQLGTHAIDVTVLLYGAYRKKTMHSGGIRVEDDGVTLQVYVKMSTAVDRVGGKRPDPKSPKQPNEWRDSIGVVEDGCDNFNKTAKRNGYAGKMYITEAGNGAWWCYKHGYLVLEVTGDAREELLQQTHNIRAAEQAKKEAREKNSAKSHGNEATEITRADLKAMIAEKLAQEDERLMIADDE